MKPVSERLNDRLEREGKRARNDQEPPGWLMSSTEALDSDPEVDELVTAARQWQSRPQLQADSHFSDLLERRLLQRQASLRQKQPGHGLFFPHLWRTKGVLGMAFGLCLLILFLGTGVLVVAAQVSNPENPLYAVKNWEQQVQVSLASSPASRAALDVQFARQRLGALAALTGPAHVGAYPQALADFDQQMNTAADAIQKLVPGPDRDQLSSQLTTLEVDARHTLRGLLPQLTLAERLLTTDELGRLGDTVPRLLTVVIVLSAHPNVYATISMVGQDMQPGAQLLVNGQVIGVQGVFQSGSYVFTTSWNGNQRPQSIGILNPDGTIAQTTAMTMRNASGNGSNGNGNGGGHGNGNSAGKPGRTPTPHHLPTTLEY